jgi:hypothetical protein
MSQTSYVPLAPAPQRQPPASYTPGVGAAASAAQDAIEVRFDDIRYIAQKDGFFNVEYALKLPSWAAACTVRLALANESFCRDPDRDSDHIVHRMPSLVIPPNPARQGRKGKTGVNLTEYQAKLLLWFMSCFGMWGRSITAYLVIYVARIDGRPTAVKVSNPVILDCPLEPAYFGGFSAGDVERTRPLGQALNGRNIPYETNGCLLLNLDVFGVSMWFFHSNKKLITATHPTLRRGVNCITFADAAVGTELDNVMGLTGKGIADAAGATMVLDGVLGDEMRAYFNDTDQATWGAQSFVFWWDAHVVIIYRGLVCEYAHSAGTYRETPVQDYLKPFHNSLLYLARL